MSCALLVKESVQSDGVAVHGTRRGPLIGQVRGELLSGSQVMVLQYGSAGFGTHAHPRQVSVINDML